MIVTLTVKLRAHSKSEALELPGKIEAFRETLESFVKQYGFMGVSPDEVIIRPILLDLVRFD